MSCVRFKKIGNHLSRGRDGEKHGSIPEMTSDTVLHSNFERIVAGFDPCYSLMLLKCDFSEKKKKERFSLTLPVVTRTGLFVSFFFLFFF